MTYIPFLSVIIPAYNTEKYIGRCLESLCRQTYQKFEAIIVNDGSTDNTGRIADEWARKDNRIKVLHTLNSGVAQARNIGLQNARGKFVGFVDSDDWTEPEMFAALIEAAEKNDADIAICGHLGDTSGGRRRFKHPVGKDVVWPARHAQVKLLLDYKIRDYLWDKIYKKELFDGIEFPKGHLFEDQQILYKLFENASKVCYVNRPLYHYVQRGGSILNTKNIQIDIEYLHSQLSLLRYVEKSGLFSKGESLVLRSYFSKNLTRVYRRVKKTYTINDLELNRYQKYYFFYMPVFDIIAKCGRIIF